MWNSPRVMNILALSVGIAALVVLIVSALMQAARSPRFSIQRVVVSTPLKKVDATSIERIVRKELRGTYFTLNLINAQQAIKRAPWVKSVSVRRVWPRALEIRIQEYEAFARWNAEQLVTSEGEVFSGKTEQALPQLRGPDGSEKTVLSRFIDAQPATKKIGFSIRSLELSPTYSLSATLDNDAVVYFGRDQFEDRLTRLVDFAETIRARVNVPVEKFDLRYSRGIAVAFKQDAWNSSETTLPKTSREATTKP
jgi:cell division protein FtsQ